MEYSIQLNMVNKPEKSVKAFATVVFGDSFKITNVAVFEGNKGNFVSMPSFRTKERDEYNNPIYRDVCNPITKEFRERLYGDILELYDEMEETGKTELTMEADEAEEPEFTVRVTPFEREGSNLLGLARVCFDESFVVGNISILRGKEEDFIAMPSYKTRGAGKEGKPRYRDVCFPITKEFREKLYGSIMETYQEEKRLEAEKNKEQAESKKESRTRTGREEWRKAFR